MRGADRRVTVEVGGGREGAGQGKGAGGGGREVAGFLQTLNKHFHDFPMTFSQFSMEISQIWYL